MIIENKLALVINFRKCLPMCASITEDVKCRKEIWNFHFPPDLLQLIVLHDSTNVTLKELTDSDQHNFTRSEHCKEWCAKGGDVCQCFGQNRGLHLHTGSALDTLRMKLVKVLEQKKGFQDSHSTTDLIRKTIRIFDKGCRSSSEAAKLDQACLQPHFSKSDTQF